MYYGTFQKHEQHFVTSSLRIGVSIYDMKILFAAPYIVIIIYIRLYIFRPVDI